MVGVVLDKSKPDGTPRKLMSGEKLASLGWKPNRELKTGILETYQWFLSQEAGD